MAGFSPVMSVGGGVSVIVPTYNRAHYLRACLDSLLNQTVRPLEVIVVDDGSTDATATLAAEYGDRIRYLGKQNGGKPLAVRSGLEASRGDWIWIFDDDDVALPSAIASRLSTAADNPDAGFVYAPHLLGVDGPSGSVHVTGRHEPPQHRDDVFFLETMRGCFFHLNSCLVRRNLFERLNGLDPSLRTGEDYDFQIRLARIARPAFCREPAFIFRKHSGVRGSSKDRYRAKQRSEVFRRDSRTIGERLFASVPIGSYLSPATEDEPTGAQLCEALLNRMHVMANHGHIEGFLNDLGLLMATSSCAVGASMMLERISHATKSGWARDAIVHRWPELVERIDSVKTISGGRVALRSVARGLWGFATGYPAPLPERLVTAMFALRLAIRAST